MVSTPQTTGPPALDGAEVATAPVSTAPVSTAPVSTAPVSTAPVSTTHVSTAPVPTEDPRPGDPPVRQPRHFPCFDGLRAIAAVSVLLLHTAWASGFTVRSPLGIYTSRLDIGVSVFFLVSGFLLYRPFAVSHLTLRPSPDTRRFWERRLLRIVPAYWLALTVLTYLFHSVTMGPGWGAVLIHFSFLQIYFPTQVFYGIGPAWSLCTEMSFYLFLPLYAALLAWRKRSPQTQLTRELVGLGALVAISYGFRWWVLNQPLITVRHHRFVAICAPHCDTHPAFATLMVNWLPAYLDLFAFGMFLAVVSAWWSERRSEPAWLRNRFLPWISWLGAAAAFWGVSHLGIDRSPLYVITPQVNIERQALYGLFAFLLLLPAVFGPQDRGPIRRALRAWPVASIGVISYAIYLWHFNLTDLFMKWAGYPYQQAPYWIVALAVLALSIAFASASYFAVERPILRAKGRLAWWSRGAPTRTPGPPAPVPVQAPVAASTASSVGATGEETASRNGHAKA